MNKLNAVKRKVGETKKTFTVAVVATMSSGKSTLLNAMLGASVLPSKNEACTAIITRMVDVDGMYHVEARAVDKLGQVSNWHKIEGKNGQLLNDWNCSENSVIEIRGDFPHIDNYAKQIEFIDTPGPNNSMDKTHAQITHQLIEESAHSFIVYVMNATQFGVDDERDLLEKIADELKANDKRSKIVFVLNKIDEYNIRSGETPRDLVQKAKKYLNECGFYQPIIIPAMSLLSLQIRQLMTYMSAFDEFELGEIAFKIKKVLKGKTNYLQALLNTDKNNSYHQRALEQERAIKKAQDSFSFGGYNFTTEELIEADILSGIPFIEEMLEVELMKEKVSKESNTDIVLLEDAINELRSSTETQFQRLSKNIIKQNEEVLSLVEKNTVDLATNMAKEISSQEEKNFSFTSLIDEVSTNISSHKASMNEQFSTQDKYITKQNEEIRSLIDKSKNTLSENLAVYINSQEEKNSSYSSQIDEIRARITSHKSLVDEHFLALDNLITEQNDNILNLVEKNKDDFTAQLEQITRSQEEQNKSFSNLFEKHQSQLNENYRNAIGQMQTQKKQLTKRVNIAYALAGTFGFITVVHLLFAVQ